MGRQETEQNGSKYYPTLIFVNTVLICYYKSHIFENFPFFKDVLVISELWLRPAFWWRDITV